MSVNGAGNSTPVSKSRFNLPEQVLKGIKKAFGRDVTKVSVTNKANCIERGPSQVPDKSIFTRKAVIRNGKQYHQLRETYRQKHDLKALSYQFDPKDKTAVKAFAQELRDRSEDTRKAAAASIAREGREVTKEHLMEKATLKMPYEKGDLEWLAHMKSFGYYENVILHTTSEIAMSFILKVGWHSEVGADRIATRSKDFTREAISARKDYLMQHSLDCSETDMAEQLKSIIGFPRGIRADLEDLNTRLSSQKGLSLMDKLKVTRLRRKIRNLLDDPVRKKDMLEVNKVAVSVRAELDKIPALKANYSDWPSKYPKA